MPKIWDGTIETHRASVRDAVLDAAALLVDELGVTVVTMSQIAESAGIGRATLYRYFPDLESILMAWHERQVKTHVAQLAAIAEQPTSARERLAETLTAFAMIAHQRHDSDLVARLHQGQHVAPAHDSLADLIVGLLAEAAAAGDIRDDISPSELASYCLHALGAASSMRSKRAVHRLVTVTIAGISPTNDRTEA